MPSEEENVQYLYLVLTHGGVPTINWDAVGAAMDLKKGAVSKRWSRLKKSMEKGETPNSSVYQFLWLCVKHSSRENKTLNWNEIAKICDTTPGAASKRYSRMKQAFEAGGGPPGSNPTSPTPKTPSKKTQAAATDNEATPTPKRKRASPKKKIVGQNEVEIKPEQESDEDEDMLSPKKAKVNGKANVEEGPDVPLPTTETTTLVKNEVEDHVEDIFIDAKQWVDDLVEHGDVTEDEGQATRINDWLTETV